MYTFKRGRYVGLPAVGCISNAKHVHLSHCIFELCEYWRLLYAVIL